MKMNEILKAAAESFPDEKRPEIAVAKYFQAYKSNADVMLDQAQDAVADIGRLRQIDIALNSLAKRKDKVGEIAGLMLRERFQAEDFNPALNE